MSEGYAFVPLPNKVERRRRAEAVFDRQVPRTLSGILQIHYLCEQPVHVGSGFKRLQGTRVVREAVRIQDGPGVPGASLKGLLRSRFEAITHSCTTAPSYKDWDIRSSSTDIKGARFSRGVLQQAVFSGRCMPELLCPACALFGCMSQRSRVSVTDLYATNRKDFQTVEVPEQFGPNIHHVGKPEIVRDDHARIPREIFEVRTLYGRKFALGQGRRGTDGQLQAIESIPAGAMLEGLIRFMNVLPAELGGLLTALGRTPSSKLKLGAAKCYGLGRLALQSLSIHLRGQTQSAAAELEEHWRADFAADTKDRFPAGEEALVRLHQGAC